MCPVLDPINALDVPLVIFVKLEKNILVPKVPLPKQEGKLTVKLAPMAAFILLLANAGLAMEGKFLTSKVTNV